MAHNARISGAKISGDWFKIAKHKTKSPRSFGVQAQLAGRLNAFVIHRLFQATTNVANTIKQPQMPFCVRLQNSKKANKHKFKTVAETYRRAITKAKTMCPTFDLNAHF